MTAYPDTSFLFGLYIAQNNTAAASAHAATLKEPLPITSFLRFEFGNAVRGSAFRKAFSTHVATAALAALDADIDNGRVVVTPCAWETVHREAERLSNAHTLRDGQTSFDILHVATARTLGAKEFLTFDAHQRKLAAAEGLKVKP